LKRLFRSKYGDVCLDRSLGVHLGGLDDGHGAGQRFGAGVGPGGEPVLPADSNRAQGAFGGLLSMATRPSSRKKLNAARRLRP
jgi:hypothetical protein